MSKSWLPSDQNTDYNDFEEPSALEADNYDVKVVYHEDEYEDDSCCSRFLGGMRGFWATKHTEETGEDRELYIKTTLRELAVYMTFLVILMIITFGMTSGLTYYYTNILNGLFITSQFQDNSGSYSTAACSADYFKFLNGPLMSGLYWNQWYNNLPVSTAETNFIYFENKLIGLPRLRQVRVQNNSCPIPSEFSNNIRQCYASYSPKIESKDSYGLVNSTAWTYTSEAALQGLQSSGTISSYSGGGFYVDLNNTQADSLNTINYLFQNLWIDRQTRAVILDFTVYNANINLFCVIKLIAEFPATGGMVPNFEFRTVKLIRYVTPMDYFVLAVELLFLVFIIYYIVEEIIEIRRHKLSYFQSFWNCLDIVVIVISILCIAFNIYRTISVQNLLQDLLAHDDRFPNFDFLSKWQLQFNYALALTLFLSWVKLFKYISFNKTMTQLSSTLGKCAKDLLGFAVMFFIIFLAFAQLGYLLFGSQCQDYRAFDISIYTLFRLILGDFDFNSLATAYPLIGPIYFLVYVFFVFFVLFNMFLAIINDTYSEVKAEMVNQANEFEMGDYFKQRANLMLQKLNLKKENILGIQNAMNFADANNDNKIDFDEWKIELRKRGFGDEEIEAVFAKYDIDGDRVLDEFERKQMQDELENQKVALNKEITQNVIESTHTENMRGAKGQVLSLEEYSILMERVDQMDTTIGSIITKIDGVIKKIGKMEKTKSKRRETMGRILETLTSNENISEEDRRRKLEELVTEESNKMDKEYQNSGRQRSSHRPRSDFEGKY